MFRKDFTFTKRQIGMLCAALGILALIAILSIDQLSAGREGGVGPAQRIGLGLATILTILGLTLIPLGDDLA
jgi:hypothetical protein